VTQTDKDTEPTLAAARPEMSGLEFFRQMMLGRLSPPPLVALLGLRILEVGEGRVVFAGTAQEQFYNGTGVAHGGWAATLLDSALGSAINTTMPPGRSFITLELKINYTRPLRREVGEVRCEATVIHVGNRTATAQARIVDSGGKIYAHGTTTCILVEPRVAQQAIHAEGV
jgi:uncharacterized protein (TIGR00369 family)